MNKNEKILNACKIFLYIGELFKYSSVKDPYRALWNAAKCIAYKRQPIKKLENTSILEYTSHLNFQDLNSILIIPLKICVILSLYDGQWVVVYFSGGATKKIVSRWVRICCERKPSKVCCISSVLFHNISKNINDENLTLTFNSPVDTNNITEKIVKLWDSQRLDLKVPSFPPVAKCIKVSLIKSPNYSCSNDLIDLLKSYFYSGVIVSSNDILSVQVPSYKAHLFTATLIPPSQIFICVNDIEHDLNGFPSSSSTFLVNASSNVFLLNDIESKIAIPNVSLKPDSPDLFIPSILKPAFEESCKIISAMINDNAHLYCKDSKFKTKSVDNSMVNISQKSHLLIIGDIGSGYLHLIQLLSIKFGFHVYNSNCWTLKGDNSAATITRLQQKFIQAKSFGCVIFFLDNIACLINDKEGNVDLRVVDALCKEVKHLSGFVHPIFFIARASDQSKVNDEIWNLFTHHIKLNSLTLNERKELLQCLFESTFSETKDKSKINSLAQQTSGFLFEDFFALNKSALRLQREEVLPNSKHIPINCIQEALQQIQENKSKLMGTPKIPKVNWQEVGGLKEAKREIINTIQLPIQYPGLVSSQIRRSGVLLYGPPGTGKTLLAKAVATECGLNFISVKGPELLNMYVGQSEQNVREVFSKAKAAAPCVIFFDELDSLAPNRGRSGDSGGVMDRIVSSLLTELDGLSSSNDVFILAATNRPDLVDPGLLRAGRFEKSVYLGPCETDEEQLEILTALTKKIPINGDIDLQEIVKLLPKTLTGADFYAFVTDALYNAIRSYIVTKEQVEPPKDLKVNKCDFEKAAELIKPSLSKEDLNKYKK